MNEEELARLVFPEAKEKRATRVGTEPLDGRVTEAAPGSRAALASLETTGLPVSLECSGNRYVLILSYFFNLCTLLHHRIFSLSVLQGDMTPLRPHRVRLVDQVSLDQKVNQVPLDTQPQEFQACIEPFTSKRKHVTHCNGMTNVCCLDLSFTLIRSYRSTR